MSARPPAFADLARIAVLGLAAGLVGGLALALARLREYADAGFPRVLFHASVQAVNDALPWGLLAGAVAGALVFLLGRRAQPSLRLARRRAPWLALALLAALVVGLNAASWLAARCARRPNIIVLLVDVLGAEHLGVYGYERPTSPQIDRFAADCVVFTQAIAQSTFTKTSVASLFTGLYPYRHGVYRGDKQDTADRVTSDVLGADLTTLAEALRERGLVTAAWVHNAHLRAYLGFDQGYLDYHDQPGRIPKIRESYRAWRARLGRVDPFFAYFHFIDLHGPNRPEPPYAGRFGHYSDAWSSLPEEGYTALMKAIRAGEKVPDAAGAAQLRADHDAVLLQVDADLGRLLDDFKAEGIYDDSLIVLTGDHGEAFMQHGIVGHSWIPHEELIRVPLLVKLPGSRHAGRRVHGQVRLVDLAPTLVEFAGGRVPPGLDGTSLMPFLGDQPPGAGSAALAVSEHGSTVALRSERWKYIRLRDGHELLHDLTADPAEQRNVIEAHPGEAQGFAEIARRIDQARKDRQADEAVLDPDTVEALRALGYLE